MALFGNKKTKSDSADKAEIKKEEKKDTTPSMEELYAEKESVVKSSSSKTKIKKTLKSQAFRVLVKPVVTEKATNLVSDNKYAFIVHKDANKISIAKTVKDVYGVEAIKVNIINMEGKRVSRGRIQGKRSDFKKALVTLKKGDSISLYEGV